MPTNCNPDGSIETLPERYRREASVTPATNLDLDKLKAAALAAGGNTWALEDDHCEPYQIGADTDEITVVPTSGNASNGAYQIATINLRDTDYPAEEIESIAQHIALANPAVVLKLIARLERAEAALREIANNPDEHGDTREKARSALAGGAHD